MATPPDGSTIRATAIPCCNKLPVIGVIRMTRGSSTEIRRIQMTRAKRERRDGRKRWRRDGRGSIKTWASRCSQPERIHG
jgi:hypothetical protein